MALKKTSNIFKGGLVMDLAPELTPNEVLTNALNATLVTYNGNEGTLQNDMGNGRVETAFLPEGYIPVGTCEFGGIIYIVSYNPLENLSLIGCFPSPERNISSDELNIPEQNFQASSLVNSTHEIQPPVKQILYDKNLHPGDKFQIYSTTNWNNDFGKYLTGYKDPDELPKLYKISIVSIEESGRMNYLDSTVKRYENYKILDNVGLSTNNKVDIDSYRNAIESGYSVFQSKISGKLALLIEVERITSFSCGYKFALAQ